MKRNRFIYGMMAAAILLAASCTDFDDYNQANQTGSVESNKTLWENISSRSELSDFASLLIKGGYDKELSKSRFYTVWAPENGSFDFASYNQMDSTTLVDRFIKSNISDYNYVISGVDNERVHALNEKAFVLQNEAGMTYDDNDIITANIPSINGTLHITDGAASYRPNIYEYIFDVAEEGVDTSLAVYLKKYETVELDINNSVPGPIDTLGQQTYSDSVFITSNVIVDNLRADLDNEDSVYTMLFPSERAYKATYDKIRGYFRYADVTRYYDISTTGISTSYSSLSDANGDYDSDYLTDSLANWFLVKDLVMTHNNGYNYWLDEVEGHEPYVFDTLMTTTHDKLSHAEELISYTVGDPEPMSNGYMRRVDSLALFPWEVWCPEIDLGYLELSNAYLKYCDNAVATPMALAYNTFNDALGDFVSGYIDFVPRTDRARPSLYFTLPNVRSTRYNVYVVFVPANVNINSVEEPLPFEFEAALNYTTRSDGTIGTENRPSFDFDGETFEVSGEHLARIDTFLLGEVEFPYSYAYLSDDCMPYLRIDVRSRQSGGNTNRLRIAAIILRPVEYDEFLKKENESL